MIIADGFSCREQIEQTTNRKVLHLAQVLQMALHQELLSDAGRRPEDQVARLVPPLRPRVLWPRRLAILLGVGGTLGSVGVAIWRFYQKRKE